MKQMLPFSLLFLCALAWNAHAQSPVQVSGAWSIYSGKDEEGTHCTLASQPLKPATMADRDTPYVIVLARPGKPDEVSVYAGFDHRENSATVLSVDGKPFRLFTKDERAWMYTEKQDAEAIRDMMRGETMTVEALHDEGGKTEDTYSLAGFTRAYKTVKQLCQTHPR